jgi:DNA adenine methylase
MKLETTPVRPVSPAAPYLGGKRNLARRLVALIATIPHQTYVEPFVGMGGIFLRRTSRPRAEVMNDISTDVTNLSRILQRHYVPLMDMLRWQLTSRAEFERLLASNADTLTDLERAARFLYLQRTSFGGKVSGRSFGIDRRSPGRFDVTKLEQVLADIHERLAGVVIERLPYAELIRRYDGPETLFYLDPPYWGCERDYGDGVFGRDDFQQLSDILGQLQGRFVLSINATPGAREVFGRFHTIDVETTYTIATASGGSGTRAGELIVSNGAIGES